MSFNCDEPMRSENLKKHWAFEIQFLWQLHRSNIATDNENESFILYNSTHKMARKN